MTLRRSRYSIARILHRARRALTRERTRLWYHVDEPATNRVEAVARVPFSGWTISQSLVTVAVSIRGGRSFSVPANDPRPDVAERLQARVTTGSLVRGFHFAIDATESSDHALKVSLAFSDSKHVVRTIPYRINFRISRSLYKQVWNSVSTSERDAKVSVAGYDDEDQFRRVGEATRSMLETLVNVGHNDIVLEIGAGVGRVGAVLAPHCKEWIGADVSENMLAHLQRRLSHLPNVRAVPLSGFDLRPIADGSSTWCTAQ